MGDLLSGAILVAGTLATVACVGWGVRCLLAARAADGPVSPPGALVLGGTAGAALGLAFAPFALTGALPAAVSAVAIALLALALAGTIAAWALLRRARAV